jgi:LAO/AO transport system kinase
LAEFRNLTTNNVTNWQSLYELSKKNDFKSIARCISIIENELAGYEELLMALPTTEKANLIGITGPPGAGKSTLVDGLIGQFVQDNKKVAVLCVDPSSPFNLGALLGDRIRMSEWYTNPNVFIRSLATRGSLGGLHPRIIEITDFLKATGFDLIIVETVGVGQSEIEIAGLADATVVVLVPEAGDEIQTMKAGLMEIADIFVINKADRPDADTFTKHIRILTHSSSKDVPVVKTIASAKTGIDELAQKIMLKLSRQENDERKFWLLAERAYQLIRNYRMKDVTKEELKSKIKSVIHEGKFNLYSFVKSNQ